ncbi:MAG TPA: pitrilysin family protein [Gemmatimonadaceae bacterium]|nr:pitrilysin family protein [Gemmatimonadaceae bacterium]
MIRHALWPLAIALPVVIAGCASGPRAEQTLRVVAEDGETRVAVDSLTTEYDVEGLRVIQRGVYSSDVVAVRLYLLGGVRQLTPATQGIESMLLEASSYGSARYPRAAMRAAVGRTGSGVGFDADMDWSVYQFHGLRQAFDSTWAVWADRLLHPTLDSASVELVRSRMIRSAARRRTSPDAHVYYLADSLAFAGHPYALHPSGIESSLAAITDEALRRYHREQLVTSRMLLVVVGNVPRGTVEGAVRRTFGTLPRGSYVWTMPEPVAVPPRGAVLEQRSTPTNYLLGLFDGPPATSPDHPAFEMALAILSSRLYVAVRDERGLSYSASAPFLDRALTGGGVSVTTSAPETVVKVIREQMRLLRAEGVPAMNVQRFVEHWTRDYFETHATSAAQASYLGRSQLLLGDWRKGVERIEALRAVRSTDLRRVSMRYMRDIRFAYVGDTTKVDRKELMRF